MIDHTNATATCLFGCNGGYTRTVLETLLENALSIEAIVLAGTIPTANSGNALPLAVVSHPEDVVSLASRHGIPVHAVNSIQDLNELNANETYSAHHILVACFPYRIPDRLLRDPARRFVNIHPSLLPAYRGPDPLFWQLRNNERLGGVTLHRVTNRLDAGDIISQSVIRRATGAQRVELEYTYSRQGARLYCEYLTRKIHTPHPDNTQVESHATYQGLPQTADYLLSNRWSAEHAFNFIRGTCSPTGTYSVTMAGDTWLIKSASHFSKTEKLAAPYERNRDEILIQFSPGILYASL